MSTLLIDAPPAAHPATARPRWEELEGSPIPLGAVWLPEQRVYVANDPDFDDDYFQCGMYWYVNHGDYWYRARSWRGPFAVIEARYVPQSVMVVPTRHWRHPWVGPRHATYVSRRPVPIERVKVKHDRRDDHWRDRDHDRDRDHGRGKGHH